MRATDVNVRIATEIYGYQWISSASGDESLFTSPHDAQTLLATEYWVPGKQSETCVRYDVPHWDEDLSIALTLIEDTKLLTHGFTIGQHPDGRWICRHLIRQLAVSAETLPAVIAQGVLLLLTLQRVSPQHKNVNYLAAYER